jgi:hypothetical protein
MSPLQLAKFYIWVENNEWCMQVRALFVRLLLNLFPRFFLLPTVLMNLLWFLRVRVFVLRCWTPFSSLRNNNNFLALSSVFGLPLTSRSRVIVRSSSPVVLIVE